MNWIFRHPLLSLGSPRRAWAVTKAQAEYVKGHPACAWCGSVTGVEAHHIAPYSRKPELATDPHNFVSLCRPRGCHLTVGHFGAWSDVNPGSAIACSFLHRWLGLPTNNETEATHGQV